MVGRRHDDGDLADMIAGHERFRQTFAKDREFLRALTSGEHSPRMLWIGCSDARVIPNEIVSAEAGELFVIRNVGNVVPPSQSGDASVGAAIEFAVMHLKVDDIVVCGHTGCGGVAALGEMVNGAVAPHFQAWVGHARACHDLVRAQGVPEAERLDAAIRANVQFQIDHLLTYDCVRKGVEKEKIRLHAWVYDVSHGEILAYDSDSGAWRHLAEMAS
ncbi:MAG: carbonic anhydrase [Hyphomicrobiaceae bacterium]|nr:MAG: carbonic anhydrase [Hyphomicrobiaceae bacterium]